MTDLAARLSPKRRARGPSAGRAKPHGLFDAARPGGEPDDEGRRVPLGDAAEDQAARTAAAFTSSPTWASYWAKFLTNMPTSLAAWAS